MNSGTSRRRKPYPRNRPCNLPFRAAVITLSVAGLILLMLLSKARSAVAWYKEYVFPSTVAFQTSLTNPLPFSASEFVIGLLVLGCLGALLNLMVQVLKRRRSFWNAVACGTLRLLSVAGPVLVLGYGLWGLNYAGESLTDRLGWSDSLRSPSEAEEDLLELAQQAVDLTNGSYLAALGMPDLGRPSAPPFTTETTDQLIEEGLFRASDALQLELRPARLRSRSKPVYGSYLLSWLGISGFYFPWTGEANFNSLVPEPEKTHSIAHEKAHQLGFAREDEANFVGFLATVYSPDPYLQYSGYLFAQVQLLRQLARRDGEEAGRLVELRLPGVQRDRESSRSFWETFEGRGTRVTSRVNDTYLRMHGVEGGVESYSRSVRLLILYGRTRGGLAP